MCGRTLRGYREYLRNNMSLNDDELWEKIKIVVAKAIMVSEPHITPNLHNMKSLRGRTVVENNV